MNDVRVVHGGASSRISGQGIRGLPGPQGPQGPQGIPGSGAVDTVARDMISTHIIDDEPHPVYDDMQSLVLVFNNHLI